MVTIDVSLMVLAGAAAGWTSGLVLVRYTAALFYEVKPTDLAILALPWLALLGTAVLAAPPGLFARRESIPSRCCAPNRSAPAQERIKVDTLPKRV